MVKTAKNKERKKHFLRTKEEREEIENLSRKEMNRGTERRKKGDEIESIRDLSRKIEGVRLSAPITVSIHVQTFSNSIYIVYRKRIEIHLLEAKELDTPTLLELE